VEPLLRELFRALYSGVSYILDASEEGREGEEGWKTKVLLPQSIMGPGGVALLS
jgi:hypothetical protein